MTSHLLLEGILDVKDPRGSEDRKFWKAWRRLWISFSVIYPSGRREPYLLLNLSHNSSEAPEKKIKIARDGLRLFRCRSKSRSYRTWAIASGNKMVLYFAAESEIQGQNWMQSVRDGLWPPCFSFQMLTACSQEVSLIDDNNTFLSGILGVYGRLVLTSEDVISLMHPHWGATLLEISLTNIKEVLFVREAEVPPAGVFSIVLKRVEGSKVKTLQFFCNTAKEAIHWILSKLYAEHVKETSENKVSTSNKAVISKDNIQVNCGNGSTDLNVNSSSPTEKAAEADNNTDVDVVPQYENMQHLKINYVLNPDEPSGINMNNVFNSVEYERMNKRSSAEDISEHILLRQSRTNDCSTGTENAIEEKLPNFKSNDSIYVNVIHGMGSDAAKSFNFSKTSSNNTEHEYENTKFPKEVSSTVLSNETPNSEIYSIVNKSKTSNSKTTEAQFLTNLSTNEKCINENGKMPVTNAIDSNGFSKNLLKTNKNTELISSIFSTKVTSNGFPIDNRVEPGFMKASKVASLPKDDDIHHKSQLYSTVSKSIRKNLDQHMQEVQLSIKYSLKDYRNIKMDNSQHLPNLPSDFLNTSLNFVRHKDKVATGSSSFEDEIDISTWISDGSRGFSIGESLYEDILDRKGTVYEEIDTSDDESTVNLPPELPKRPTNLEIPDSLRLQKLSKSINQTLNVMKNSESQAYIAKKEYPETKFIKKIKDASRIMQISPNKEHARDSFAVKK